MATSEYRQVTPSNTRIVVVGAGIAGLSAAHHLLSHGFANVTILEATERLGGRVHTKVFGDNIIELGANWIHGGCGANSMFTLANQLRQLPERPVYLDRMDGFCYTSDGRAISKDLTNRVWRLFQSWEAAEPSYTDPNTRKDLHTFLRNCLEKNIASFDKAEQGDVRRIFNCLLNYCRFHNAGYLRDVPVPNIGHIDIPGGDIKVPSGIKSILESLVQDFPERAIRYGRHVTRVVYDGLEARVQCTNGEEYLAEHVIFTISLGCLKAHAKSMFNPSLPEDKYNAIQNIQFGKVNKIFFLWDKPFWTSGLGSIKLGWTDAEAGITSTSHWYKKIFGFDEVLGHENVLVALLSGDEAAYVEQLQEKDIIDVCIELIRKFLKNPSIERPSKVLVPKWCSNPYTLGSYSYGNLNTTSDQRPKLGAPLYQGCLPRVMFAGEATSVESHSSMHGARDSGLREANRLVEYYGLKSSSNL